MTNTVCRHSVTLLTIIMSNTDRVLKYVRVIFSTFYNGIATRIIQRRLPFSLTSELIKGVTRGRIITRATPSIISIRLISFLTVNKLNFLVVGINITMASINRSRLPYANNTIIRRRIMPMNAILQLNVFLSNVRSISLLIPKRVSTLLACPSSFYYVFNRRINR